MFGTTADNYTLDPNGKLITPSTSKKEEQEEKYSAAQCRPTAGCHFAGQGGILSPSKLNINRSQRRYYRGEDKREALLATGR